MTPQAILDLVIAANPDEAEEVEDCFTADDLHVDKLGLVPGSTKLFVIPIMDTDASMGVRVVAVVNLKLVGQRSINMGNPTCEALFYQKKTSGPAIALLGVCSEEHDWGLALTAP